MNNELIVRHEIQLTPCDTVYMWHDQGMVYQQHGEEIPEVVADYGDTEEGRSQAAAALQAMEEISRIMREIAGGLVFDEIS